jgi:hypothetical protein
LWDELAAKNYTNMSHSFEKELFSANPSDKLRFLTLSQTFLVVVAIDSVDENDALDMRNIRILVAEKVFPEKTTSVTICLIAFCDPRLSG